jgi:hypothetical protein
MPGLTAKGLRRQTTTAPVDLLVGVFVLGVEAVVAA